VVAAPGKGSFIVRALVDKLFRDRDSLYAGRLGRWIVTVVALALGVVLVALPTSTAQEGSLNRLVGFILLGLGALTLLYALLCECLIVREGRLTPEEWARQEAERRVREGVEQAAKMRNEPHGARDSASPPDTPSSQ
jgi:hypothetical protein